MPKTADTAKTKALRRIQEDADRFMSSPLSFPQASHCASLVTHPITIDDLPCRRQARPQLCFVNNPSFAVPRNMGRLINRLTHPHASRFLLAFGVFGKYHALNSVVKNFLLVYTPRSLGITTPSVFRAGNFEHERNHS